MTPARVGFGGSVSELVHLLESVVVNRTVLAREARSMPVAFVKL